MLFILSDYFMRNPESRMVGQQIWKHPIFFLDLHYIWHLSGLRLWSIVTVAQQIRIRHL